MWKPSLHTYTASSAPRIATAAAANRCPSTLYPTAASARRCFHEYFITHLPSTSLHPDSRVQGGPHHKLPRDKSTPHELHGTQRSPAAAPAMVGASREMTVVRIPLRSAKHHFGVSVSRGTRPYNEDSFQAGTVEVPAFAKRPPRSLQRSASGGIQSEVTPAEGVSGDPQVFYFGVFDGHGGSECSDFLREELHEYIEEATKMFDLRSSLVASDPREKSAGRSGNTGTSAEGRPPQSEAKASGQESLDAIETHTPSEAKPLTPPKTGRDEEIPAGGSTGHEEPLDSDPPVKQGSSIKKAEELERDLVKSWKELVGGYFRRFKPEYFSTAAGGRGHPGENDADSRRANSDSTVSGNGTENAGIETVLQYSFLRADYDFVSAQVGKQDEDSVRADKAINDDDILGHPSRSGKHIGGPKRFKGGSTGSVALISTPTPAPFWNPSSPSSLITAHVGDTRILLCDTATGLAVSLTSNHHPSLPAEATRLRRYAATFVTDSFGEERMTGLANTRAFGDMASKRMGVSAEPEIRRIEILPAQYSFLVLCSDGVSGHLSDQEIVDIVKEAQTPEQAARDVTNYATEVKSDSDNATTLVVRLGGWERRSEGGLGSMGTKEMRDWRKSEALDPRRQRW